MTDTDKRTFTVTLTEIEFEALYAWSDVTDPEPCSDHEDGEHGDRSDCFGYAPEVIDALGTGFEAIFNAWAKAETVKA